MRSTVAIISVIYFASLVSGIIPNFYHNINNNLEFTEIYLVKSITNKYVHLDNYLELFNNIPVSNIINSLNSLADNAHYTMETNCNQTTWLKCGYDSLNCVDTCKRSALSSCVQCLGEMYAECCGCLAELVHKDLPECACSATHHRQETTANVGVNPAN